MNDCGGVLSIACEGDIAASWEKITRPRQDMVLLALERDPAEKRVCGVD